ncbi:[protein-PII] uridylyltransferase [Aestuariibacter halophilus]|uniref:Bifunctional uridylyltransferase/uridylyl-removing enzyme n=1 Tax=Fluctibacter halophilus TaxID=226011 RepID=A0ABS8GCA2_9ALTE|nr:[protein-PII] uridylyltransferase [Aestuariibacter halophilus]MCC2618162.1 [protein-PII] uridylyltransferase [Aestuariibacter halophilus]
MSLSDLLYLVDRIPRVDDTKAFKDCVERSYQWLDEQFNQTQVDELVHGRATFVDALLCHAWRLLELDKVKHLSLVAVGGYGRGQLQPHSDIDLLILSQRPLGKSTQETLSRFITLLWDIKLDVGQAVRTVKQTISLAKEDITIATNLVESRLLIGCQDTFAGLQTKMRSRSYWSSKDFFIAKHNEQKARHAKFHGTAYNLEPNVKENPGCLRDIQSIGWVAKKHFQVWNGKELVEHGYFTAGEWAELIECRSHLWKIRFALHLEAGRSENRLLFDYQADVARRLGYGDDGKASVERMMKAFFRIVRRVNELNDMLLQHFTQDILALKVQEQVPINADFELNDGLITPTNEQVFDSPESILQFLLLVADTPAVKGLHSSCLRQLRNARRAFHTEYFCTRPTCRELFMQLLRHPDFFGLGWDLMHRHGILQAYLPQWDQIVGMMQFDLFHAYTVDEHTHRLVKHVYQYHQPEYDEFPRCKRIVKNLDKPELLYIAAIFHDIGKGRGGDHSQLGAVDVAEFCESHGIEPQDAELVRWLVASHLLMSVVAQRRDIYDPDVINDFAGKVKSHNHLNHLYALTLADIRATNDNLWNDWKSSLLRELYLLTQKALDNGLQCQVTLQERVAKHQAETRELLLQEGIDETALNTFWARLNEDYFARFKPAQLAWHARTILTEAPQNEEDLLVDISETTNKAGTELLVYGKDRPALFAQVASVLDSRNCSIHDAQILSTMDGYVFDSFLILEQDGTRITSPSRLASLEKAVATQLTKPGREHTNKRKMSRQMKQLNVPTKVRFYSNQADVTLMEMEALDAPGLLAKIGHLFVALNLNLHMAKISTIGERAEDLFIISNADDQALTTEQQVELKQRLTTLLDQSQQSEETCLN